MLAPTLVPVPVPVPLPSPLARYDIRVWRLDIDIRADPVPGDLAVLSPPETARLRAYRRVADRARFAAVRGALRRLLGAYLDLAPWELPLQAGLQGKPILPPAIHDAPRFNVSHSGRIGLIAIATDPAIAAVGVDVEQCRPVEPLALAASAFSPDEQTMLHGCHPALRLDRFYALWTAREALTKAAGTGIADARWQQVALQGSGDGCWRPRGPSEKLPTSLGSWHPAEASLVVSLPCPVSCADLPYRAAVALLARPLSAPLSRHAVEGLGEREEPWHIDDLRSGERPSLSPAPLPRAGEGRNSAEAIPMRTA
ncbi:4'-phosphopantetheinyl transferase superfamily protein [Cupriavidus sp. UGS-1]|uniref:4'-phosphopantetheinyl transferase family protein n=1 Tax=Cupriavidus sp. UGS-1 TaxID=2899826 RepID=UPI001E325511|nr:4'-phosphopantetheinyl transferase superfamily protein [Cupriavidus sp. UGS-1]MCD9120751.1 4'-phosphopantetheinyl transferase superfamily protein [Cupriavidus sp. UGS-1]